MTGYPSIDKPWLKYYSKEAINAPLPEMTMYQYIWENNKDHLSDIALRYYGTKITYGRLFDNIKRAASAFYSMGVRAGDIVTIMSMHTPETIYAIYGLNYIGAVANLVYMTLAEKEILHTIENTESKLLLVLDVALEKVEAIKDRLHIPVVVLGVADSMPLHIRLAYQLKRRSKYHYCTLWRDYLGKGTLTPLLATERMAAAIIVYTSGSTGNPKGVVLNNDALNAYAFQVQNDIFGTSRKESFLLILPPFVGFGIATLHEIICNGYDIIPWIDLKPDAIINAFFRVKPNHFIGGPALIETFINHKPIKQNNLKLFIGGGGALAEDKEREINQFLSACGSNCIYAGGYGLTEGGSTLCSSTNEIYKLGSSGIPLVKTNVKVVDTETGETLPYGKIGELHFSTPDLMAGYYNNDHDTNEILYTDCDGTRWVRTGDLGYVDSDGFVFIKGRIKRIFITRGKDGTVYKLFPQRIEEFFLSQQNVDQCGVVVKEIQSNIYAPIVFISLKEANKVTLPNLYETARKELPDHLHPDKIVVIDKIPLTQSGKINYRALEEMVKGN